MSLFKCMADFECYQVVLLAVKDSSKRTSAYIVGSFSGDEYPVILRNHVLAFSLGSLLFFLAFRYYRNWLRSQQQLQTISANMAEGMYVMNKQGEIVFANKAAEDILGFTRREMLGKNAHSLFHHHSSEERVTERNCQIRSIPLTGEIFRSSEETFTDRDGNLIRADITSSPLRSNSNITGAVVLFRDITQDYENRIRQKQTDTAFQNMSEAVVVTDADVRIVAVNQAFTEITGYSEAFVIGKNPSILASGMHDRAFYQSLWHSIEETGAWEGEVFNRRKNGEVYPEWINISVVRDHQNQVLSYVAVFSDITEKQKKEQRLQELAYTDQLTNLPNRTSFMRLLEQSIRHSNRVHTRLALLYLDLDHFKQINDTLGHLMGDKLLSEAAKRLKDIVREDDVLARLGGDEFIFMIETFDSDDDPARVAKKLLESLGKPFHIEDRSLYVSASIGISLYPDDGDDSISLLKNADAAMYRAKHLGRGNYSYFTEDMAREAEVRFHIESDLRNALRKDKHLRMAYQPKFSLKAQKLIGCEALIRWEHFTKGLICPADFLPIAQDSGLMPAVTEFVIRQVSRQIHSWNQSGIDPGKVSINLDSQSLKRSDFTTQLLRIVQQEEVNPEQIEIEITETVILEHSDYIDTYTELVASGFSISIDDFGTGESSLFRLKQIPANTLKVDRTFIMDIAHNNSDQAILRSIIGMAKTLGKSVLCEGVEDSEQLSVLKEIGCDEVQGYYLAKPMYADSLQQFYASFKTEAFK
ncbi:MAG: EAL domain-containing protein [Candidatus Thiodiazotropha sp.]